MGRKNIFGFSLNRKTNKYFEDLKTIFFKWLVMEAKLLFHFISWGDELVK